MIVPLIFLIASFAIGTPTAISTTTPVQEPQKTPQTLEQFVREYYADTPILAEIARCESRFKHVDADGQIHRGEVNSADIGVMQINTRYHEKAAQALGVDIYSLGGNLAYAQYLYEKEGTQPWSASKACWGKKVAKK